MQSPLSRPAEVALWSIATLDSREHPPDFAVLRVPSIVENYVDSLLEILTAEYLTGESPFEVALEQLARERLRQNWSARRESLRDSFRVSVDGRVEDQDFMLLVQLRNAIAHGTETLTRLQTARLSEQLELERSLRQRLLVRVDGNRLRATRGTASSALRIGNRFVRVLDAEAGSALRARGLA
ncbi:hypothetical protein [Microbacterium rhizomatis]|uniref:RiboL-PSP-HEPN domain-containing protein n=1 Tax=Microbacterium rhizomatis TaxID=1631477 RepID=A0A5J5IW14_9MICO|nr:hypothetical protein [Microbacterium rhizomatis]KAA9105513.1 hypothetical protein F6B43_17200 [Microbacterium rhizomatis]